MRDVVRYSEAFKLRLVEDVAAFAHSVRTHWGDRKQTALDAGCTVSGRLRPEPERPFCGEPGDFTEVTLNLIRLEPTEKYRKQKFSLNRKRLYASYESDFLLKILLN
jgi:hypothetical protein